MKLGEITLKHESEDFELMVNKFIEVNNRNTQMLLEAFAELTQTMIDQWAEAHGGRRVNEEESG